MIKYLIVLLFVIKNSMAYEEAPYKITYQSDTFEVRFYEERVVIQTSSKGSSSGFQKLFKYISGNNQNATKIEMTTPVTMLPDQGQWLCNSTSLHVLILPQLHCQLMVQLK